MSRQCASGSRVKHTRDYDHGPAAHSCLHTVQAYASFDNPRFCREKLVGRHRLRGNRLMSRESSTHLRAIVFEWEARGWELLSTLTLG
jgi:hypothetical protein